ncbi:hypothetical protein ACFQ5N_03515 [Lutibacter holmesii]|uniref:STAS domain-containing protein n=1 Tax=Lutibacter holmesii TaxID=1137985 RepID=A0ABW3WNS7_9FLAO
MIIKYQVFEENQLLVLRYEGVWCFETYKQQVLAFVQTPEWKSINKFLVDLRYVEYVFNNEDIALLLDVKKNIIQKNHVSVQLVDKPMITALTHLMQEEFGILDITTEYCCTVERAIELLDISFNENQLTNALDNLELSF